jgi:eukaryotic-like serine/threonine-protein kinase
MAPEQAAADPHTDHRADIYSFGILGYEVLTGRLPFPGPSPQAIVAAHLVQAPPPLAELRPSVPPALAATLMRCLEKRPADRWQTADELLRALEALGATTDGAPTAAARAPAPRKRTTRRSIALLAAAVGLAAAVAGWLALRGTRGSAPLDADLMAVAPFDVPDGRLSLWREGLVDVLSRNLDGAGPLRTVAPTVVIRRWTGRADRPSAAALAHRTGARLVVFGSLIGAGPDSARLAATAFDVQEGRPLADIELRDAASRMDRLADSLTVRLLRELGRTRRIEVLRTASLGSTSLPALKAFLQGEHWFRRASWDSALAFYDQAIALDSAFPLALRRAGEVLGWQRSAFDSGSEALKLRAATLNHGLAPRDSLLLTTDSLFSTLYRSVPRVDMAAVRRLHGVAEELTRRYPEDFEAWYVLGEARYHFGSEVGSSPRAALEAFDRAIRSDSAFAPAYIHAVELALWLDGPAAAHRYTQGYLALSPTDASAEGIRLVDRLVTSPRPQPEDAKRLLRAASPSALDDAWLALRRSPDSLELSVQVARALADAPEGDAPWLPRAQRQSWVGSSLMFRGHVRDAARLLYRNPAATIPPVLIEAALLAPELPDSAMPTLRGLLAKPLPIAAASTLPVWAARGDSHAVREVARHGDSVARSTADPIDRGQAIYASEAAHAYLALMRHDTATALRRFEALPDSLCPLCYLHRLTLAQLLSARQEDQKAAPRLDRWLVELLVPSEVLWTLERARVAERMGDREKAIHAYQYVADVWRHADPELQPYVTEAREGLKRLTSEPSR